MSFVRVPGASDNDNSAANASSTSIGIAKALHLDRPAALSAILLAGLTLAVFAPVISFQFLNVDDNVYVIANDHVRQGLTRHNAAWALTAPEAANWHPVTWLSHMLDVTLFG